MKVPGAIAIVLSACIARTMSDGTQGSFVSFSSNTGSYGHSYNGRGLTQPQPLTRPLSSAYSKPSTPAPTYQARTSSPVPQQYEQPKPSFQQQPEPQPSYQQQPEPQPSYQQQPEPQPSYQQQPEPQPSYQQQPEPQSSYQQVEKQPTQSYQTQPKSQPPRQKYPYQQQPQPSFQQRPQHQQQRPAFPQPQHPSAKPSYSASNYQAPKAKPTKLNCTIEREEKETEACVPTLKQECKEITLMTKKLIEEEECITVTSNTCKEIPEEVENEICTYAYHPREEKVFVKSVDVDYEENIKTNMITVCKPIHGYKKQCNEAKQKSAYNLPSLDTKPKKVNIKYPDAVRKCITKRVLLPRIKCEEKTEEMCMKLPKLVDEPMTLQICKRVQGDKICENLKTEVPSGHCEELLGEIKEKPEASPSSSYNRPE